MMKSFLIMIIAGWFLLLGTVQATGTITVKYLSAENVYLDAGEADGLTVGAQLAVLGTSGVKAEIEVVYVAAHSASCKLIGPSGDIKIGDKVQLKSLPAVDSIAVTKDTVVQAPPDTVVRAPEPEVRHPKMGGPQLFGSVAVGIYHWNDMSASNLDFTQTTARISVKARRLWGKDLTLAVRGRGRFDKRQRDYRTDVGRNDWQNRLWEFSLSYEEPSSPVRFYAGRILPRQTGGIGYLDGLLVESSLSGRIHAGFFAGTYPGWLYDERPISLNKTGGYLSYVSGNYSGLYFEQNVGAVGEYHARDVNREFLVLQGRLSRGALWGISHTGEIDINRSWRKERSGKTIELTNLYLNSWVRPIERVRLSLSYDNRTNYWTFDNRSVADSLFDDNLRQGVRLQTDINLPADVLSSGSIGYRDRAGDPDPSWSYSILVRKGNALFRGMTLSAQYAGFDNSNTHGYNYTLRTSSFFHTRYSLGIAYGRYAYRDVTGLSSGNSWVEFSGQTDVSRHHWLGLRFQKDTGDDIKGFHVQSELGYRF